MTAAVEHDVVTPCAQDPDMWYDRARLFDAAELCLTSCPLLEQCRVLGRNEKWGVWGGEVKESITIQDGVLEMKWCPKCETRKSIDDFGIDRSRADGTRCYCRSCYADMSRERRKRAS